MLEHLLKKEKFSYQLLNFNELVAGIIDFCFEWNLDYIGGDLNETKELIINPTVFGFQNRSDIIYRNGLKQGDYLLSNGKFGLTDFLFKFLSSYYLGSQ